MDILGLFPIGFPRQPGETAALASTVITAGIEDIMANRNFISGGRIYSMHVSPVLVDMNFQVDNTSTTGITALKGPTVEAVYMNSAAATPAKTIAAGTILVQLQDNYMGLYGMTTSIISPNSGSDVKIDNSAMTAGVGYTITTLGNATAAKWVAIGVPIGITPAVGVNFIAATNGGAGNTLTSRVQTSATTGSGVATIELLKNPNSDINPAQNTGQTFGAQFILQCRDYAGAAVAPAAGSIINVTLYLRNSSVTTAGE